VTISTDQRREFGGTGLSVPPVVFGTAVMGNEPVVVPEQRKLAICGEWLQRVEPPVFVSVAYEHGDGLALEVLGRILRRLDVANEEVIVHLSLDSINAAECWDKSCRLLGEVSGPKLASVSSTDGNGWQSLCELKAAGRVRGIGVTLNASDSLDRPLLDADFVTLRGGFSLLRHDEEVRGLVTDLAERQIPIVVSDVFEGDFLLGGSRLDGRALDSVDPADRSLLAWRTSFAALCHGHGVSPAHACVQFALAGPGVVAVQLESSDPDRVAEHVESVVRKVPDAFWAAMKEEGLLEESSSLGG
jgi:D-threo-aldose 1-dehydrogenase